MNMLTRAEEFALLAIWRLQGNAYSIKIQQQIYDISGEKWSLGTIYAPLERLEKRGYIESYFSGTTPQRGGRQRRIYRLTKDGQNALLKIKKVHESFWRDLPGFSYEVS